MSNAALSWAFRVPISGVNKAVLIALAEHADDQGSCWPSVSRLILFSGWKERAVRNALRDIETAGLVRTDQSKGRTSNRYILSINPAHNAALEMSQDDSAKIDNPALNAELAQINGAPHAELEFINPAPHATQPGTSCTNPAPHTVNPAPRAPEPLEPSKNPQGTLIGDLPAKVPKKGGRIPTDWKLTDKLRAYAIGHGVDPDLAAEEFFNYWTSVTKNPTKTNWDRTFENRVLELMERGRFKVRRNAQPSEATSANPTGRQIEEITPW